ncbi:hypothetical protein ABTY61_32445 [Kitasatospora sp. NPDC096128]|uniref:WD40 repeat domain-containing protein n=1 Tax=Kitasatospora sp. NPDC096128 TaxID=3155547 RepID=UPI003319D953
MFTAADGTARLATGSSDLTVRIWDPATGTEVGRPLTGHTGRVWAVAVFTAADGTARLATGSSDLTVRIWDPATGTEVGRPLTGHTGRVWAVAVFTAADGTPSSPPPAATTGRCASGTRTPGPHTRCPWKNRHTR